MSHVTNLGQGAVVVALASCLKLDAPVKRAEEDAGDAVDEGEWEEEVLSVLQSEMEATATAAVKLGGEKDDKVFPKGSLLLKICAFIAKVSSHLFIQPSFVLTSASHS